MADVARLRRPLTLLAPAKLNLGLEVLGRRSDGLHELMTLMQTVSVFDRIELRPSDEPGYQPDPRLPAADLARRALRLARDELGLTVAARVALWKSIPIAAGLGGGSSDAGTILAALAALAGRAPEEALPIAARLGSDVPFFLRGGTALATGTGATVEWLPPLARTWFVVLVPDLDIPDKTATLYRELLVSDLSDGARVAAQAARLRARQPLEWSALGNAFSRPLLERAPARRAVEDLRRAGAEIVLPTGAGPAVFAPFRSWAAAAAAYDRLSPDARSAALVCTTIQRDVNRERTLRAR